MSWEIKSKNNEVKFEVAKIEYNDEWMQERYVTVTIESPGPINFQIGDYLIYRGERFEINYDPGKIKSAEPYDKGDAFLYENVKFNSLADELTRCDFLDVVLNDNQLHFTGLPKFSFYGGVQELANRIQANLDRTYGKNTWKIVIDPEFQSDTELNISIDTQKVSGALETLVNDFKTYYTIKGRTITIGAAGVPADHLFQWGPGKGLYEIEENAEADQQIVTRLRAYGSTRNLPHRYYNSLSGADGKELIPDNMAVQYLMLPSFPYTTQDPYIDSPNIVALGVREGSIFFDGSGELEEIYPSIEGMTAEQLKAADVSCNSEGALDVVVSAEQMTDNGVGKIEGDAFEGNATTTAEPATFKVTTKDVGFDINDHIIEGNSESPTLSFKSGMLGGRDFEIVKCTPKKSVNKIIGYELELNRVYDEDIKLWFPYKDYNAKKDDKFVLLNIRMPEVYIKAAAQRLFEAAKEWLSKNDYSRSIYAPKIDENFMARQHDVAMASGGAIKSLHDTLCAGMQLLFEDEDFGIDAAIFIDRLTIVEGEGAIPTYEVVLKEEKTVGRLDKMQNQIDSLAAGQGQGSGGYNASQIRALIDAYGGTRFLSKIKNDRTPYKLSSDSAFEVGNYMAGATGGIIGMDADGDSFAEVARLYVRVKAFFEELTIIKSNVLAGKQYITPGGGIKCVRVEETENAYRCYFLSEQDGEKTYSKFVAQDQAICEQFNVEPGTSQKVSNRYYWRLVTAVVNDAYTDEATGNHYGYVELSKSVCDNGSDSPLEGDEICQFGYQGGDANKERRTAMVFSTVDADAPSMKLFSNITSFSLNDKAVISFGRDAVTGQIYFRLGNSTAKQYLEYTQGGGLKVAGSISSLSTYDDGSGNEQTLGEVISDRIIATNVLYILHDSKTNAPALPTVSTSSGEITNLNGWSDEAPEWQDGKYMWQCTYVRKGDGSASFSGPTCIAGATGQPGTPAKSVVVNADTQAFVYEDDFKTLIGPQKITLSATLQGTAGYQWSYKRAGESEFTAWPDAAGTTDTVTAGANGSVIGTAKSVTIRCTSGAVSDEVTIYKVSSGKDGENGKDGYTVILTNESHVFSGDTSKAQPASVNCGIIVYKGNAEVTDVQVTAITGLPSAGMSVANYPNGKGFTVTVNENLTKLVATSGVLNIEFTAGGMTFQRKFSWVLSLAGRGILSIVEEYAVSSSATTAPADSEFKASVPTMTDANPYLWNREKTTYTDGATDTTPAVVIGIRGQNGADGATVVSVTNYYLASNKSSDVTKNDAGWSTDPTSEAATVTSAKPYLWNYEVTKWSKGADTETDPHIVGAHGSSYTDNLIIRSNVDKDTDAYLVGKFRTSEDLKPGVEYTCTVWGELGAGKTQFDLKVNGGNKDIVWGIKKVAEGKYSAIGKLAEGTELTNAREVLLYQMPQGVTAASRIDRIKLEEGINNNPQWSPNSLEMVAPTITEEYYLSSSNSSLEGGSWKDAENKDAWQAGWFVWTRSKISYATGEVEYTEPVCVTGAPGIAGTSVLAQYSVTGGANDSEWHPVYQAGDVWMRTSDDGGQTWSPAIRMQGASYSPNLIEGTEAGIITPQYGIASQQWAQYQKVPFAEDIDFKVGDQIAISVESIEQMNGSADAYSVNLYGVQSNGSLGQSLVDSILLYQGNLKGVLTIKAECPAEQTPMLLIFPGRNGQLTGCQAKWHKLMVVQGGVPMQWTPAASEMIGKDGQYRKFQWAIGTETAATGTWQDTPMNAPAGQYVWMHSGIVVPPATEPTSYDPAIRLTGDKGANGDSVYLLDLSNEMAGVACDSSGNPVGSLPQSALSVYRGGKEDSGWKFQIAQSGAVGCTAEIADNVLKILSLSDETASVTVMASKDGVDTLMATMNVYKVIPGKHGADYSPNLLLATSVAKSNANYNIANYKLTEIPEEGEEYTFTLWGELAETKTAFSIYNTTAMVQLVRLEKVAEGVYRSIFKWKNKVGSSVISTPTQIMVYTPLSSESGTSSIDRVKLEKGANANPQWTPAASEMVGEDAVVYSLQTSVDSITRSPDGELSTASVTVDIYKTVGNALPVKANSEGFIRYQFVYDTGASSEVALPVDGNGGFEPITVPEARRSIIRGIIILLYPDSSSTMYLDRERIPVASNLDEIRISSRNLLIGSKEFTIAADSTQTHRYKAFSLPIALKAGDYVALNIESITNDKGSATQYTAALYNNAQTSSIASPKLLTASNRTAVFKVIKDESNPKFLLYAGVSGSTNGNTVTYRKAILTLGTVPMQTWQKAPEDFEYLEEALKGNTDIDGGLVLSSLIKLGTWVKDGDKATMSKVWSGISGINPDKFAVNREKLTALWFGGDMVDRYYTESGAERQSPLASGYANGLFRMDATGYLAGGLIEFLMGAIRLAEGKLVLDANGLHLVNTAGKNVLEITQESITEAYGGGDFLNSTTMTINSPGSITHYWNELGSSGVAGAVTSRNYLGSSYLEVPIAQKNAAGDILRFPNFKEGTKIKVSIPSLGTQCPGIPGTVKFLGIQCHVELIRNSSGETVDAASYTIGSLATAIEHEFVVEQAGQYRIGISYGNQGGDKSASGILTLGGKVLMTIDEGTRLAPDGFVSAWGQTAVKFANDGIFLRHQLAGIKLTSDGIHYMTDGETWKQLN